MRGNIHTLNKDEYFEGVRSWSGVFNLNGHQLKIGAGGVNIYENLGLPKILGGGSITSSIGDLRFYLRNDTNLMNGYVINAAISDNSGNKVGVTISGKARDKPSHIDFVGGVDNTFSGDVHISNNGGLLLYKDPGVTAVRGDIYVSKDGYLALGGRDQISDSAKISLSDSTIYFSSYFKTGSEKIRELSVTGRSILQFGYHGWIPNYTQWHLYLDDLEITGGSELIVGSWIWGRDHILVDKKSMHINDALSRIRFDGYAEKKKGTLREYDKDYWEIIPGFPEPATYGAALSVVGLGLVAWRKRQR